MRAPGSERACLAMKGHRQAMQHGSASWHDRWSYRCAEDRVQPALAHPRARRDRGLVSASTSARFGDLPYGPRLTGLLEPLYRGLGVANRYLALPLLRAGLGPLMSTPLTGSLMILRTRGRKTGLLRETPLGYAILDGSVWCCAGFGAQTHWYRNILADAGVEVVLANGSAFAGTAEIVTEHAHAPDQVAEAVSEGGGLVGDVSSASD